MAYKTSGGAVSGGSLVLIQTQTASASTNIDFTTGLNYPSYLLVVDNVTTTTGIQLKLLVSDDGGSTFETTGYVGSSWRNSNPNVVFEDVTSYIPLVTFIQAGSAQPAGGSFTITGIGASLYPTATGTANQGGGYSVELSGGSYNTAMTCNGLRITLDAGTIDTGTFTLYGLSDSGSTAGVVGPASSTDRAIATWNGAGGGALFNNSTVKIDSSGRMTNTTQPAFYASLSTPTSDDVTGDGTVYVVIHDTEYFDVGNNYDNTTGIFTAPVTGKYHFTTNIMVKNYTVSHTLYQVQFVCTARTSDPYYTATATGTGGFMGLCSSVFTDMTAGDTAYFTIQVNGSTKTVGVNNFPFTSFSGYLVC